MPTYILYVHTKQRTLFATCKYKKMKINVWLSTSDYSRVKIIHSVSGLLKCVIKSTLKYLVCPKYSEVYANYFCLLWSGCALTVFVFSLYQKLPFGKVAKWVTSQLTLFCRVILLLVNSFDLEEGSITQENFEDMKSFLASSHPGKFTELLPQIKNCSLEAELDTVSCFITILLLRIFT